MAQPELLYYFTLTKYALEGVKNRRLKVAELDKTNDPYDLLPFRWNEDSTESFIDAQHDYANKSKMICFSETCQEPSLWGHYADSCMGICLGFEIDPSFMRLIVKIKYEKDRLNATNFQVISDLTKDENSEEGTYDIRAYKSHHWEHENEWRVLIPEEHLELDSITGRYFFHFNFAGIGQILKLRKILIGFRCEEKNIKRRFEKLTEQDSDPPEIFFTRLSSSDFKIEVDKNRQR